MEGVTTNMYRNLKRFWRRKGYRRLNAAISRRRRRTNQAALGGAANPNRRRLWKIRIFPKLRILFSPKKLLIRLRDAYVNFMLRIASSAAMAGGGFGAVDSGFGMRPLKEYDEKVITEIYRSLVMAQGKIMDRDAPNIYNSLPQSSKRLENGVAAESINAADAVIDMYDR